MVHRFQELDNYDDYDPVPYQGGYDINAAYGGLKAADEECAYRRTQFEEHDGEREGEYGNENNPYERGPPGPSIYGDRPKPGAVYGGGRDRTRPSYDDAQLDEGVETGYGRRKPAYEEHQSGYRRPFYSQEEESSGYSKPRPSYGYGDEEESGYRKPVPHGYGEEEESGYRKSRPTYGKEDTEESGYGKPSYGYGEEESGYRKPYNYSEEEDSGYRKPRPTYGEEEMYGRTRYSREEESSEVRSSYGQTTYGEEEGNYGGHGRRKYGEEASEGSDYGGGYGGRRKHQDDDDAARFGGGSVYTEEPLQEEAPARRSWW